MSGLIARRVSRGSDHCHQSFEIRAWIFVLGSVMRVLSPAWFGPAPVGSPDPLEICAVVPATYAEERNQGAGTRRTAGRG